jgi:hypothetical protein
MSGETEEMSTDLNSVGSNNLVWTDNPELAYFRSMMADADDSLFGPSFLQEMIGSDRNSESFGTPPREHHRRHQDEPIGGKTPGVDTSGLSYAEDDTIDNINAEEGSILAWFSRQRMERARKKAAATDDGTLESDNVPPDIPLPQLLDPPSGIQPPPRQVETLYKQQHQQRTPQNQTVKNHFTHDDNIEAASLDENVPGFIFVTAGHSSSVHTQSGSKSSYSRSHKNKKGNIDFNSVPGNGRKFSCATTRITILFLVFAVILASIMLALVLSRRNEISNEASSAELGGGVSSTFPPVYSPFATIAPTVVNRPPNSTPA